MSSGMSEIMILEKEPSRWVWEFPWNALGNSPVWFHPGCCDPRKPRAAPLLQQSARGGLAQRLERDTGAGALKVGTSSKVLQFQQHIEHHRNYGLRKRVLEDCLEIPPGNPCENSSAQSPPGRRGPRNPLPTPPASCCTVPQGARDWPLNYDLRTVPSRKVWKHPQNRLGNSQGSPW